MPSKDKLTPKQESVLNFIRQRIQESMPPTIREIARELGFSSTGTVRDYLKALVNKGYLKRSSNKSRGIELLEEDFAKIPIIASIAAGKPDLAYEDIQGYVDVGNFLPQLSKNEVFALRVKGESMLEAGILDGDIAVIRKQPTANSGEIIVALLDNNEVTLKRLRQKGKQIFLEAAHKHYPPLTKDFTIIGKLITLLRKY